jgi:hypothetical protein
MKDSKVIQLQLEDKNAEFEQLALVLHRTRGDLTRRLEKQQKEYDDKIAFLIQQLRGAEMKVQESSSMLRRSFEGDGSNRSPLSSPRPTALRPQTTQGIMRSSHAEETQKSQTTNDDDDDGVVAKYQQRVAEATRKWETERQRRELLEKRNGELMRELRAHRERERK